MSVPTTATPITTPPTGQSDSYGEIIAAADGFWVVFNRTEGTGSGIFAQRYDLEGEPVSEAIQVAPIAFGNAAGPEAVSLPNGDLVVFYVTFTDVFAVTIDGDTGQASAPVLINDQAYDNIHDVVLLDSGDIAMVTNQFGFPVVMNVQIISPDLSEIGPRIPMPGAEYIPDAFAYLDFSMNSWNDGGMIVYVDRDDEQLYGQAFGADGQPEGSPFQINSTQRAPFFLSDKIMVEPRVQELAGGGFVVIWNDVEDVEGDSTDQSTFEVRARVYDAAGNPVGDDFIANETTAWNQSRAEIIALPDGGFVLGWTASVDVINKQHVIRYFDENGNPTSGEIVISEGASAAVGEDVEYALLADGSVALVYPGEGGKLYVDGFTPEAPPPGPTPGADVLEGTAGADEIDALAGNDIVHGLAGNDILLGNAGNDQLFGDEGDDVLNGGTGADSLAGGLGRDWASYEGAAGAVGLNLATGTHTGDAAGDTFSSIERWQLSSHADSFVGAGRSDYVYGGDGADTLSGGAAIDRLYGEAGDDTLNGDAGNDVLEGGAGADTIRGGAGKDGASYAGAASAVSINLTTGVHTGDAAGDTFEDVEFWLLSGQADTFVGAAGGDEAQGGHGSDSLSGAGGADWLRGQGGHDVLNGEDGNDVLEGGVGADQMNGGDGTDYASYVAAVGVNLSTNVHTGEAAGDTFNSVERFRLSGFDDSFVGWAGVDWAAGYQGADTLDGAGGNDTLNGGIGDDVLIGGSGRDKLIGELGDDTLTGGAGGDFFKVTNEGFGDDVVTDFENGLDLIAVSGFAGAEDFSDLALSTSSEGWAVVTFPDGSTLTLEGVAQADIDAADFLFA